MGNYLRKNILKVTGRDLQDAVVSILVDERALGLGFFATSSRFVDVSIVYLMLAKFAEQTVVTLPSKDLLDI